VGARFQAIGPYINTTVIKDFKWVQQGDKWIAQTCPLGEGMVDFKKYFTLAKVMNIAGPISMHFNIRFSRPRKKI
jgi:sugar phosphate isomerase/epimerase